jgi:hypothetical protein
MKSALWFDDVHFFFWNKALTNSKSDRIYNGETEESKSFILS